MLTKEQLSALSPEHKAEYEELLLTNNKEGQESFEYFFGFTNGLIEEVEITNKEVALYQEAAQSVTLKAVAQVLGFTPHAGQQPLFFHFDERSEVYNNFVLVLGRRAQTLDSKIYTPTGFTTFRDVQAGQEICDPDGGVQKVLAVHNIYQGEVVEVELGRRKCKVDTQHLFTVYDNQGVEQVLNVNQLRKGSNYKVYNAKASFTEKALPTEPYGLGCTLETSIPQLYLQGSEDQRLALLRGLMDTSGRNMVSYARYTTASSQLAEDVEQLVMSLGGNVTRGIRIPKSPYNDEMHNLYIMMEDCPFTGNNWDCGRQYNIITNIRDLPSEPVRCISVSAKSECYITDDFVRTHNTGKSYVTSVVAIRELLLPFSSTILLTPTFNNAQIIFNNVLKLVQQLKLPILKINKGQFRFELENGARFSANSASNVESALGSANSLLIVDESQSIPDLERIMSQMLVPTLLDMGTKPSGILYGHQMYLGTPRGRHNVLFDLYERQDELPNWKSFSAPSHTNPTLPTSYLDEMRLELGEELYSQEILAKFLGSDKNVFHAFSSANIYDPEDFHPTAQSLLISGLDIGFSDQTASVWIYREPDGTYRVVEAYQKNKVSTKTHHATMRSIEQSLIGDIDMRYGDPAAAQSLFDYTDTYDYAVSPAKNPIKESLAYINLLLTPTGANEKPRLFISSKLTELIRQMSRITYKDNPGKNDPYEKDSRGTHWDLIAALRYALYSDQYNFATNGVFTS